FLKYLAKIKRKKIEYLMIEDISTVTIKKFLLHLEVDRHSSTTTRNQRLAALHAFAQFVGLHNPEFIDWSRQINMIPFKKGQRPFISYLEKNEIDALLNLPDCSTQQGQRDHVLLLLLYNTGARADEVAKITIADLSFSTTKRGVSSVLIHGKGAKQRRCPL